MTVGLVTNYPALPAGTRTVDVEFPGFGTFRAVPMAEVGGCGENVGPAAAAETGQWTYSTEDPPYGWPTSEWPTDTPDTSASGGLRERVEPLLTLPAAR